MARPKPHGRIRRRIGPFRKRLGGDRFLARQQLSALLDCRREEVRLQGDHPPHRRRPYRAARQDQPVRAGPHHRIDTRAGRGALALHAEHAAECRAGEPAGPDPDGRRVLRRFPRPVRDSLSSGRSAAVRGLAKRGARTRLPLSPDRRRYRGSAHEKQGQGVDARRDGISWRNARSGRTGSAALASRFPAQTRGPPFLRRRRRSDDAGSRFRRGSRHRRPCGALARRCVRHSPDDGRLDLTGATGKGPV